MHQLMRDIDDEEAWIREKEPIALSTNRGRDLIGVQNLMKKHQGLQTEIQGHEPRIKMVRDIGQEMIDEDHYAKDEIKTRLDGLQEKWDNLKVIDLLDSHFTQQYFAYAHCTTCEC